jgi:mRNA-degrading endonuclease toxin of MazEF toxin-antitoxin module
MPSLRKALRDADIGPICSGDVRVVASELLTLDDPDHAARKPARRVIVLEHPRVLQETRIRTVVVVPCATSPRGHHDDVLAVPIPEGTPGFTRQAYALTYCIQAIPREHIGELVGIVSQPVLEMLRAAVAEVLDLLGDPETA